MEEKWLRYFDQQQARRPAVLRQLMLGKVTSSVAFWAWTYDWLKYYYLNPHLKKEIFDQEIKNLQKKGYLSEGEAGMVLTDQGQAFLAATQTGICIQKPELFGRINMKLWPEALALWVQVCSELSYSNSHYRVLSQRIFLQNQVKMVLQQVDKAQFVVDFSQALDAFLAQEKPQAALAFALLLAGHQQTGFTQTQVAKKVGWTPKQVEVNYLDMVSRLGEYFLQANDKLKCLVEPYLRRNVLFSEPAQESYRLFLKGYSRQKIAQLRGVKISTVNGHLLLAAILYPDFDRKQAFVQAADREILRQYYHGSPEKWRYKDMQQKRVDVEFIKFRIYQIQKMREVGYGQTTTIFTN
ncbi:helix-turn-helix domain-containing protein [Ligilactobacillus equi]|nr:helix-turn-helix domain-containing protein [Ligilactobacillus equi]